MAKKTKTSLAASSTSDSSPPLRQNSSPTVIQNSNPALVQNSGLKGALLDWLKDQPLYQGSSPKEKRIQENVVKDLADGLRSIIKRKSNSDNMNFVLLEEIKKHVQKFPMDAKKSNKSFLNELPVQILDHIKSLQLFQDISFRHDKLSQPTMNKNKKKAAAFLLEDIVNWVNNLPIEESEETDTKEQLESKLIHKIGELNMNAETFNDDFIYEDILGDFVENLLANIPSENIKNNQPSLKKDLLAIVKRARKKMRDENAGQIYKQQLHDTISKTLPSFDLSVEGKASFEVLKEDVANAFISMRYVCNNTDEANKLKKKINDEIYKFCDNYLKRCPASPLDTTKLNEALYNALNNIAEPQNESFIDDVELVKLKDEINKWVKEIPLKNIIGQEKLHTNKKISILAQKIHDVENEKELISPEEYQEKIEKEIAKFLKKIPLCTENNDDINELVEKLVKSLRNTEESRKLNASARHSLQPIVNRMSKTQLRISFHDVSVSPLPTNTCSQTSSLSKYPDPNQCLVQKNFSVQTPSKRMQAVGSQINVTPNVVVNEYQWDSIDESCMQPRRVPCPCPTVSQPPYTVIPQPLESPITQRGDESCMQSPRASYLSRTAPRSQYEVMSQQPQGSISQRESECTSAALKSCLTSRPFPLQPFENQFSKPRDLGQANPCSCAQHQIRTLPCLPPGYDYDDYDYQLPENLIPLNREPQAESTQARKQCSDQSFRSALDMNDSFERGNQHSTLRQPLRIHSPSPPYPYHLSTHPASTRSEPSPQRKCADSQSSQYPRQLCPCSMHKVPAQRNVQESQYIPYTSCTVSQQMRNRTSHQDSQPMNPSSFMTSSPSHFSQGQSYLAPQSSISFSPPPQMPCAFNPRSPCYMRNKSPISSEEYEAGLNCSFQKSATRLGTFDDEEPRTCTSRFQNWGKVRDDFEYWERDRQNVDQAETNSRKDGRRCKVCKHR